MYNEGVITFLHILNGIYKGYEGYLENICTRSQSQSVESETEELMKLVYYHTTNVLQPD